MDKNTITGLVLMAAVMFGFLWLSKPDQAEQTESTRQEQATTANSNTQTDATVALTPADSTALAATVRSMGTRNADGSYTFSNDSFNLTLDSLGTLGGTYTAGDVTVGINDLTAGRTAFDAKALAEAAAKVKELTVNAAKYAGFAKYLSGENKEFVLENELVRVTLSSHGRPGRA